MTMTIEEFGAAIDAIAAELGGDPQIRAAIAWEFDDTLGQTIARRLEAEGRGDLLTHRAFRGFVNDGITYTLATSADLARAAATVDRRSARVFLQPRPTNWLGACLRLDTTHVELTGGRRGFFVAMAGRPSNTGWVGVFLTDFGKRLLCGDQHRSGEPTATSVKGMGGARAALISLVEAHFGVDPREGN